MLTAEYSGLSATYNKLGHHGLFADRLDANYQSATLAAGFVPSTHLPARIVYQVRNRTYDPSTQRWLQRDPNATGQVVLERAFMHGARMVAQAGSSSLDVHFADSMSSFEYLRHQSPSRRDPTGLMILGFMPAISTEGFMRQADAGVKMSMIDYVRYQLAMNMAKVYYVGLAGADAMYAEATGSPVSPFGAAAELAQTVLSLGGRNGGQLLEMSQRHFRENLSRLTGFGGELAALFDAHHIIPRKPWGEFFASIGVDINLPLFGQWILREDHVLLHQNPLYNQAIERLVGVLKSEGLEKAAAYQRTMDFIKYELAPQFGFQVAW